MWRTTATRNDRVKTRRLSSPVRIPLAVIPTTGRSWKDGAKTNTSRGQENRVVHLDHQEKSNGKRRENAPTSTPTNTSASKQLTDYSAFKGRGRYGKASGNDTINATYAIDPVQNGGMDFQYDAVVRGKEDRRRMQGGDCECCRDYYEAIGPLPSRLQAPLWRSPPNSPEKNKPCRRNGDAGREDAISSHKQAISRHRHNWARANTPPSYWHIGFPSTQEAQNINEKAATMHQQKRLDIQAEAENGGRYYKTK
ncbi:DNA repair protein endonuclease SAE2/CtIP C-terminus-domain-containing protein [Mycena epipterygia]|nr:DNA repair protein endonuclease SAE2/CtIP C-terminus-domain-containing protein [Mycena epipterygia]